MLTTLEIIQALSSRPRADLKAIMLEAERLLIPADIDTDLFQAVLDHLGVVGSTRLLETTNNYKTWLKNQVHVANLINKIIGETKPKRILLIKLKKFLIQLLIEDLINNNHQVTMRTISNSLGNIEDVFSANFPGYFAAGMAPFLLKVLDVKSEK